MNTQTSGVGSGQSTTETVGRRLRRLVAGVRILSRLLPVDTNPIPAGWTHLTKVDPEDDKRLPLLFPRYLQYTDAVVVGGSTAVTGTNTEATFELLSVLDCPVFHEPSDPAHVTDSTRAAAAFIAIPQVLNGSTDAIVGDLGAGIERVRSQLAPTIVDDHVPSWTPARLRSLLADAGTTWLLETAVFEAYFVQNADSAAAREAGVTAADVLSPREASRRAMVADRHLHSPVVYVEYSGRFGGDEAEAVLAAVSDVIDGPRLWYGGGLSRRAETERMLDAGADAVVVGNAFHDVAAEEASLFARAGETLPPDATASQVDQWLSTTLTVEGTAAAAYLSTIPGVAAPTRTARRLLVDSVVTWLRLRDIAARSEPSPAAAADILAADFHNPSSRDDLTPWARAAVESVGGSDGPLGRQLSPWSVDR